ncbi:unnamed protein product, partial [Allacma fusca]
MRDFAGWDGQTEVQDDAEGFEINCKLHLCRKDICRYVDEVMTVKYQKYRIECVDHPK